MIISNYTIFIDKVFKLLADNGLNPDSFKIDHLGYQAESAADYDQLVKKSSTFAKQVDENIVGARRVVLFELISPLEYNGQTFSLIEIFEPRSGQNVKSAWEHVEFLVEPPLEEFIAQTPQIEWDTSALNRDEFPMLIFSLGDGLRAKFPRRGVLEEVNRI